jgi:hypothetical protein
MLMKWVAMEKKTNEHTNNRDSHEIMVEKPLLNDEIKHVNGKYADEDEEDDLTEDDLVLGDEDELEGDEMEFEIELEEDVDEENISEDDLILDTSDDLEEDEIDDDL